MTHSPPSILNVSAFIFLNPEESVVNLFTDEGFFPPKLLVGECHGPLRDMKLSVATAAIDSKDTFATFDKFVFDSSGLSGFVVKPLRFQELLISLLLPSCTLEKHSQRLFLCEKKPFSLTGEIVNYLTEPMLLVSVSVETEDEIFTYSL